MTRQEQHQTLPPRGLVLLGLLALGWGLNWPMMKVVVSEVPPLSFRTVCLMGGGVGLLLLARFNRQPLSIPRASWPGLLLLVLFNIIGWNVFAILGVQALPSSRAALLGYTMPLWSMLFSLWLLGDRLTLRRAAGLALGLSGIYFLMGGEIDAVLGAPRGALLMIAAALCWGLGNVTLKRWPPDMPAFAMTGWSMILGGTPVMLAALLLESGEWHPISFWPAFGLFYNVLVAFMFCYWAWNRIVLMVPVAVATLGSLLNPLIGVVSSVLLLGDHLGWREWLAAGLIFSALGTVLLPSRARS